MMTFGDLAKLFAFGVCVGVVLTIAGLWLAVWFSEKKKGK